MQALDRFRTQIGEESWQRLQRRLVEVNGDIRRRGMRWYQTGPYEKLYLLTGYSYDEFFDWDLYFENLYLSYYGISRFCRNNVEAFLNRQYVNGYPPTGGLINKLEREHFKPFLAQNALLGCRQTGNYEWVAGRYYDRLKLYLDHWFWYWDFDKNGLCVWNSPHHSGMDSQESASWRMGWMQIEGVDLSCYLYRELEAMAILAEKTGHGEDKQEFIDHAERLGDLINGVLWDEEDGFYYDRNERTGEKVRLKTIAGLLPLWLGIVPKDRAERLVHEHLLNEDEFWLKHPIATWSKSAPGYYQERKKTECNWCGPVWIPTNYMIFHGLIRHGFKDAARELAYKSFDLVLAEEDTREYYNAETGAGQGLNPFWGWSALAYFMPLEYELGYDPSDQTRSALGCPATRQPFDVAQGCEPVERLAGEILRIGSDIMGASIAPDSER